MKPSNDRYLELVREFPLKPIRTQTQLREAHAVIDELSAVTEAELSSDELDYLQVLGDLIAAYEARDVANALADVSGVDVLRHLLEERAMSASELGRLLGNRAVGSKLMRGERELSKTQAVTLAEFFGLPAETFLRPGRLKAARHPEKPRPRRKVTRRVRTAL